MENEGLKESELFEKTGEAEAPEGIPPEEIPPEEFPPEEIPFEKAQLTERYLAKLIDFLIVGAMLEVFTFIGPFAAITYISIADGLKGGQSVGKRLMGLKTVSLLRDAEACDFRESALRNSSFALLIAAYFVLGWIPYVGKFLVVLAAGAVIFTEAAVVYNDENGIRFGDKIAGTMVVKEEDF